MCRFSNEHFILGLFTKTYSRFTRSDHKNKLQSGHEEDVNTVKIGKLYEKITIELKDYSKDRKY